MQKDIKVKWVKALRSGRYKQCSETLRDTYDGKKYCCLGVLCNVIDYRGWGKQDLDDSVYVYKESVGESVLPRKLREEVGITEVQQNKLVKMNDDDGKNFKEIANWIEKNL